MFDNYDWRMMLKLLGVNSYRRRIKADRRLKGLRQRSITRDSSTQWCGKVSADSSSKKVCLSISLMIVCESENRLIRNCHGELAVDIIVFIIK